MTFTLSNDGKQKALTFELDEMVIKKNKWDGKWRLVTFDIPEKKKKVREAFRYHLVRLGFKELHKSVFVIPYVCHGEIEYLTEFYNARRFVRYIESSYIDNELDLKHQFDLV